MNLARRCAEQILHLPANPVTDWLASRLIRSTSARDVMRSRFGCWLAVGGEDAAVAVNRANAVAGRYEPGYVRLLTGMVRPGDTAIDAGANEGYIAFPLARTVGADGHVFAVEPHPANIAALREHAALNHASNVTVIPKAVSDHADTMVLRHGGAWGTLLEGVYPDADGVRVAVDTLDAMFAEAPRAERLRLIKIDVEGNEIFAIRGAKALIQARRPVVAFEVNLTLLAYVSASVGETFEFFHANDYGLYVEESGRLAPFRWLCTRVMNMLAVPLERAKEAHGAGA